LISRTRIPKNAAFSLLVFLFIVNLITLLGSCGSKTVTSFTWASPEGKSLAFTQSEDFPEGRENRFGPGREVNSYRLAEALSVPQGFMLAAEIETANKDLVLGFSLGSETKKMGKEVRFAAPKGKTRLYLSLPAGQSLKVMRLSISVPAEAASGQVAESQAGEREFEEWTRIENLALLPAFRGFEAGKEGYRISDGISMEKAGSGTSLITIQRPFAPTGAPESPVLVLRYSQRTETDIVIEAGTKILAKPMSANREILIPAGAFHQAESLTSLRITAPEAAQLVSAYIESPPSSQAHRTDPGALLLGDGPGQGQEYSWYRWDLLPSVIMFDFSSYEVQDAYLKRLAFFVEKQGFVGRLATNQEMAPLHGWNAHDYRAEDLARFFALAEKQDFALNPQELRLRDFLLDQGLISKRAGGYGFARDGVIISISRESPDYLRRTFLTHELSHAIFFADPRYRKVCTDLWKAMEAEEKWFWKLYFGWMNYNTASSYLMANEVQAYLVQQAPRRAEEYFTKTLVDRLMENHPELEKPIAEYMEKFSARFETRARELDSWLRSSYGFGAGLAYFLRIAVSD